MDVVDKLPVVALLHDKAEEPVNADKPVTEEMKKAVHEAPAHKKVEVIQQQLRGNGKKL